MNAASVIPYADEIVPGLFLGGRYVITGKDSKHELADVIVSALSEDEYEDYMIDERDFIEGQEWHRLVAEDDEDFPIAKYFDEAHAAISEALRRNKRVLVHCAAGISRSATLVAAFLVKEYLVDAQKAIDLVQRRRYGADPND